jgi:hypothetical protein
LVIPPRSLVLAQVTVVRGSELAQSVNRRLHLASIPGNAAAGAGKTGTFLGERYRCIARRCGSKRAVVAIGRSIMGQLEAPGYTVTLQPSA